MRWRGVYGVILGLVPWCAGYAQHTSPGTAATSTYSRSSVTPLPEDPTAAPDLYEIRVGTAARATMKIYDTNADVLVPLRSFCALVQVTCTVTDTARRAGGQAHIQIQQTTAAVNQRQFLVWHDTTYVSVLALAQILHVTPIVDRQDASVTLLDADRLPVVREANRVRAHEALLAAEHVSAPTADLVLPESQDNWGGFTLDYDLLNQGQLNRSVSTYLLSASTTVAGGSLIAQTSGGNGQRNHNDVAWLGVWPNQRAITQLQLGEGDAGGLGTIRIRGLTIGNVPYSRPNDLDVMEFDGTLPPDWSIEAYRSGMLMGFDSVGTSGRYMLQLPVDYGENPFTFIAYGPLGQTQMVTQLFRALPTLLPAHALEYESSLGRCVDRDCLWMMNNDVHYGLSSHWTIRGGTTEYFFRNTPATFHPYFSLTGAPSGPLSVNLESVLGLYNRAGIYIDPSATTSISTEYTRYADDGTARMLVAGGQQSTLSFNGHFFSASGQIGLEVLGARVVDTLGSHLLVRGGPVLSFDGTTLRPYIRGQQDMNVRQTFWGTDAVISGATLHLLPNYPWWLEGTAEMNHGRPSLFQLIVSQGGARRFQLNGGVHWQQTIPGMQFVLGVSTDLHAIRASTNLQTLPNAAAPEVTQSISGSAYWSPSAHQMMESSDALLGRAGVSGVVFFDRNGNGRRDPGEEAVPNAMVYVDGESVMADDAGRYQVWGVEPDVRVRVTVDTASLTSPWWAPSFNTASVSTLPNRSVSFDIPVVETGVIDGTVSSEDGVTYGPVVLTNVATKRRVVITPFSDGSFYQSGLLPGQYVATIASAVLAEHHMSMQPVSLEIRPKAITRHVELIVRAQRSATDTTH